MKWSAAALLLAFLPGTAAAGQAPPAPPNAAPNAAEYDAYLKAAGLPDLAARPAALEAFVAAYPSSSKVPDALTQIMLAYASAEDYVRTEAVARKLLVLRPDDASGNYQLGVAEVQMDPPNAEGFWYLARAINLSRAQKNEVAAIAITTFAQRRYQSFHGGIDGWDAIRVRAGVSGPIPAGFASGIARGPTPAEIAVKAVRDNDPASLSIGDWEYVLTYRDASPANTAAAAKVWEAVQAAEHGGAAMMAIPVVLVSANAAGIQASITDENIESHVPDVRIVLAQPLATYPAAGAKMVATGVITSYELHPFRFVMTKARLAPDFPATP